MWPLYCMLWSHVMRFSPVICTARNSAGEPKLAVLIATVVSIYNVMTACTAVLEHTEVWRWEINLDNSGVDNWLYAPSHPPWFLGKVLPHLVTDPIRILLWQHLRKEWIPEEPTMNLSILYVCTPLAPLRGLEGNYVPPPPLLTLSSPWYLYCRPRDMKKSN